MTAIRFPGELPLLVGPDRSEVTSFARTLPALVYAKMPEPIRSAGARKGLTDPLHAGSFAQAGTGTLYPVKTPAAGPAGPQPVQLASQAKLKPPAPAGSQQPQAKAPASQPAQEEAPGRREAPTIALGGLKSYLDTKPTPRSMAYLLAQGYPWQEAGSGDHRAVAAHLDHMQPAEFWKVAHHLSQHLASGVTQHGAQAQQLMHGVLQSRREAPARELTAENADMAHTVDLSQLDPQGQQRAQALLRGLPKVEGVPGGVYIPKGMNLQALLGEDLPVNLRPLPPNRTHQTLQSIKDIMGTGPSYARLSQNVQDNPHIAEWIQGHLDEHGPPTPAQLESLSRTLAQAVNNSYDHNWHLGRHQLNALPNYGLNEMDRFLADHDPQKHAAQAKGSPDKQLFVNKLADQPASGKQTLGHLEKAERGSQSKNALGRILSTAIQLPQLGRWLNSQVAAKGGITPLQLDQLDRLLHSRAGIGDVMGDYKKVLLRSNLADLGPLLDKYRIQGPDPAKYPSPTADPVFAKLLKGSRGKAGKKNYQRDDSYWVREADLVPLIYAAEPAAEAQPQGTLKPAPAPKVAKAKVAVPKATIPKTEGQPAAPAIPQGGLQQHLESGPNPQALGHTLAHGYDWQQATPADHHAMSEHLDSLGDSDFWETVHHSAQHLAKGSPHADQTRELLHGALWGREEGLAHPLTAENRKHAFVVDTSKLADDNLDLEGQQRADMLLQSLPKVEGVKNGVYLPKGLNLQALLGEDLPVSIKPVTPDKGVGTRMAEVLAEAGKNWNPYWTKQVTDAVQKHPQLASWLESQLGTDGQLNTRQLHELKSVLEYAQFGSGKPVAETLDKLSTSGDIKDIPAFLQQVNPELKDLTPNAARMASAVQSTWHKSPDSDSMLILRNTIKESPELADWLVSQIGPSGTLSHYQVSALGRLLSSQGTKKKNSFGGPVAKLPAALLDDITNYGDVKNLQPLLAKYKIKEPPQEWHQEPGKVAADHSPVAGAQDQTADYKQKTLEQADPTWKPGPGKALAIGGVLVNGEGKVLLRKPTGDFDGYAWTFAKGKPEAGQHPVDTALAEVAQETGHQGQIIGTVPGVHHSGGSQNVYYLMHSAGHDHGKMDRETAETRWVTPEEARQLIAKGTNTAGVQRDLGVLEAATKKLQELHPGTATPPLAAPKAVPGQPEKMLKGKPLEPDAVGLSKSMVDILRVAAEGHPQPDALKAILSEHHTPLVPGLDHWLHGQLHNHGMPTHDELSQLASLSDAAAFDDDLAKDLVSKGSLLNLKPLFKAHHVKMPKALAAKSAAGSAPEFTGQLKHLEDLGGSTGASLVQDQAGQKWVQKYGDHPEHVREEVAADDAYRALGVPVPESHLYQDADGDPFRLSQFVPGKSLGEFLKAAKPAQKKQVLEQVRQHFVADALLSNRDVAGADLDNLHVGDDGKVYRIDNGGALRFRAQGEDKPLGMRAEEIEHLRDKHINPEAASVFKGLTDAEIARQVHEINGKRAELMAALPEDLREPVGQRLGWLVDNYGEGRANSPSVRGSIYIGKGRDWRDVPAEPSTGYRPSGAAAKSKFFQAYQSGEERSEVKEKDLPASFRKHHEEVIKRLPTKDREEIDAYTGDSYQYLNEQMRECPETLDCLDAEARKQAESLQKSIAAAGKSKVPYTVWRKITIDAKDRREFGAAMKNALQTGEDVRLPGFKSSSYSPGAFTVVSDSEPNVHLEIRTRSGLVVQSASAMPEEKETILPHNARYRVTGIEKMKLGEGKAKMVYQLEEL